jgi:hypothetical protein
MWRDLVNIVFLRPRPGWFALDVRTFRVATHTLALVETDLGQRPSGEPGEAGWYSPAPLRML